MAGTYGRDYVALVLTEQAVVSLGLVWFTHHSVVSEYPWGKEGQVASVNGLKSNNKDIFEMSLKLAMYSRGTPFH